MKTLNMVFLMSCDQILPIDSKSIIHNRLIINVMNSQIARSTTISQLYYYIGSNSSKQRGIQARNPRDVKMT
jgi:hypothetical protein